MTRVWEHSQAQGTQLLLLLAIADDADDDGIATPKIQQLARKCRQSPRATSYQIATLQQIGELKVSVAKGRGNRSTFRVTVGENMQKLHVLNPEKHAIQRKENMQSGVSIYSRHVNTMNKTNNARARAREGVSLKSLPFSLPTLAQFTEEFFDDALTAWMEINSPAVAPQRATENFLEYHASEQTRFKSKTHLLNLWKGWMRNAQAKAVEKSEQRAARKESGNGTNRKTRTASESGESRNMQNLRATVAAVGVPDEPTQLRGSELVRSAAAKIAAAKRAASQRAIRDSIDRSRLGGGNDGRSG